LTGLGHDVVAVELSGATRTEGERPTPSTGLRRVADQLPSLSATYRMGLTFDVILISDVWRHVAPVERQRAMRKLLGLLRSGGSLVLVTCSGPTEADGTTHPVSVEEVERVGARFSGDAARQCAPRCGKRPI